MLTGNCNQTLRKTFIPTWVCKFNIIEMITNISFSPISAMMVSNVISVSRVDLSHHRARRSLRSLHSNTDQSPAARLGLEPDEHLKLISGYTTNRGHIKVKMAETYKGLPVIGESVVLELDQRGEYTGDVQGRLVKGIGEDLTTTQPRFTPEQALDIALHEDRNDPSHVRFNPDKDVQLVVYVSGSKTGLKAELAYKLSYKVESRKKISRPAFIINARSGKVMKKWDAMNFATMRRFGRMRIGERAMPEPTYTLVNGIGGNEKVGQLLYGSDLPQLKVTSWPNGTCQLQNDDAVVFNCESSFDCEPSTMTPYQFDCDTADVAQPVNGAYSPLNDVFFHMGITSKMFRDWYNMSDPTLKGEEGNRLEALVRYGEEWQNAAWDGERLLIGDGAEATYPLTSINMVAHEIAHGVTAAHSDLFNEGQSGAINEAFSDMAGEAAEAFLLGTVDWNVGYSDVKAPNKSFRYFNNPGKDGFSISHYRDFCFGVDSHSSSGIFNKAFYNLATTSGWNIRKAFHVFLLANVLYWHPESTFTEAACNVVSAAKDLDLRSKDVSKAFLEVGVTPCSFEPAISLPGTFDMESNTTLRFIINPHGLNVATLVLATDTVYDLEMKVETGGQIYDVRAPHGRLPEIISIPTVGGCQDTSPCHVSLISYDDLTVTLLALTPVKTILQETNVSTQSSQYFTFTMPEVLVENKVQVMFQAEVTDQEGGVSFFIKHGERPSGVSHVYDATGNMDTPAFLCRPKPGSYHLEVQSYHYGGSDSVSGVTLKMFAVLGGTPDSETNVIL